jgi:CHAD domain-containing protein
MMMLLRLKDCYERRARYVEDQFELTSESPSTGAVHDMRVGLKRLRAYFDLVESIAPGFAAEQAFAPAAKLFRAAGRVRNIQVLESKVREASTSKSLELSEYYNWLKEDERREVKKFLRACRRFGKRFFDAAWKSMAFHLEGQASRRITIGAEGRLMSLIREIKTERSMRRDNRRLHFLRTRTKEARYTLEILQECGLAGDEGVLLNDRFRDVHQSLGSWHDEEIVLGSLREFRKRQAPGPLVSFKSYLEFSRLTKAHKAEDLARFETAWTDLLGFLGRGNGRRVLHPRSTRPEQGGAMTGTEKPPDDGSTS